METIVLWPEQRRDENDFLPFERKYIEACKTRTDKGKQSKAAHKSPDNSTSPVSLWKMDNLRMV